MTVRMVDLEEIGGNTRFLRCSKNHHFVTSPIVADANEAEEILAQKAYSLAPASQDATIVNVEIRTGETIRQNESRGEKLAHTVLEDW